MKNINAFSLVENPKTPTENLRKELRAAFPNVKFYVRYKSFAGGDEIRVSYTDGPKSEAVKAIANRYAYDSSNSDIMTDYYDYRPTEFTQKYGGAKFVFVNREMNETTRAECRTKALELLPELANGGSIRRDDLFQPGAHCRSVELFEITRRMHWIDADSLARAIFAQKEYTNTPQAPAVEDQPTAEKITGDIQIIDYSEKAFAVIGDTKPIKDALRELGGRFNARLSCGAGWIFPKTKAESVRAALAI